MRKILRKSKYCSTSKAAFFMCRLHAWRQTCFQCYAFPLLHACDFACYVQSVYEPFNIHFFLGLSTQTTAKAEEDQTQEFFTLLVLIEVSKAGRGHKAYCWSQAMAKWFLFGWGWRARQWLIFLLCTQAGRKAWRSGAINGSQTSASLAPCSGAPVTLAAQQLRK